MAKLTIPFCTDIKVSNKLATIRKTNQHRYIFDEPLDIYLRKLSEIEESLKSLIKFKNLEEPYSPTITHPVKVYIQALSSFYDNISRILKYSQDLNGIDDMQNAIIWLNRHGTPKNKSFFKRTREQQILITLIDNKLKHDNVMIQNCYVQKKYLNKSSREIFDLKVNGFYICSAIGEDGLWGAIEEIHKPIKGKVATALSYNFFILNTIYSLVHWISELSRVLPSNNLSKESHADSFNNILKIASVITEDFFPDEYHKVYAKIQEKSDSFEIIFPYQFNNLSRSKLLLEASIGGGMHCNPRTGKAYQKMPYLNLDREDWC